MSHTCHAPGCKRLVPPRMFACKHHWYRLPQKIRDAVWREYRVGQEIDKQPSARYLAVQQLACAYLAFKPDSEEAVIKSLPYLQGSIRFQRASIAAGLGDPLEGLAPAWVEEVTLPSMKKARGKAKRLSGG